MNGLTTMGVKMVHDDKHCGSCGTYLPRWVTRTVCAYCGWYLCEDCVDASLGGRCPACVERQVVLEERGIPMRDATTRREVMGILWGDDTIDGLPWAAYTILRLNIDAVHRASQGTWVDAARRVHRTIRATGGLDVVTKRWLAA